MRKFDTGATRDTDAGKLDYEGFLSPVVLERFAEYMHKNRIQADGKLRDSDNWQKGIPRDAFMKSAWRHFMDWWKQHRRSDDPGLLQDSICALLFNALGYLHEELKAIGPQPTGGEDRRLVGVPETPADYPAEGVFVAYAPEETYGRTPDGEVFPTAEAQTIPTAEPQPITVAQGRGEVTATYDDGNVRRFVEIFDGEELVDDTANLYEAVRKAVVLAQLYGVGFDRLADIMEKIAAKEGL